MHKIVEVTQGVFSEVDDSLLFQLEEGTAVKLLLTGDCCSHSYFEDSSLKEARALVGQTLLSIEEVESHLQDADFDEDGDRPNTRYHAIKITTDKEVVIVDWRNESNGYYDGTCTIEGWENDNQC